MSCYAPLIRVEYQNSFFKKKDGTLGKKGFIYNPTIHGKWHLDEIRSKGHQITTTPIPCRNCIGCRLDYSREWANRGYLETKIHPENNYFLTLTYSDLNVPTRDFWKDGNNGETIRSYTHTLKRDHFTKFMHDLRQHINRNLGLPNFKFMGCGEYGDQTKRPHYHLILFGCQLPLESFYKPKVIDGETYWQNTIIEKYWKYGISNISETTWNTIAYVARYITKKVTGPNALKHYMKLGIDDEFFAVSRGIGKDYYELNKEKIYKNDEIIVKNRNGIVSSKPPKYYDNLYKKIMPEKFEEISERRKEHIEKTERVKDSTTSLSRIEQKQVEEREKELKGKMLKRQMKTY